MVDKIITTKINKPNLKINLKIIINQNNIDDIQVTGYSENSSIFDQVFAKLKSRIIKYQCFDITPISGAEELTNSLINAIKNSLIKHRIKLTSLNTNSVY